MPLRSAPLSLTSEYTSFCIEYSGVTFPYALDDHPGQLCVPKLSPSLLHSSIAHRIIDFHLSARQCR